MSLTGPGPEEPTRIGVPIGDLLAGMYGAYGVVSALYERAQTGIGGVVRTSLLAAIVGVHAFQGTRYTVAGEVPHARAIITRHWLHTAPSGAGMRSSRSLSVVRASGGHSPLLLVSIQRIRYSPTTLPGSSIGRL